MLFAADCRSQEAQCVPLHFHLSSMPSEKLNSAAWLKLRFEDGAAFFSCSLKLRNTVEMACVLQTVFGKWHDATAGEKSGRFVRGSGEKEKT